jgi:chorismate mutase
MSNQELERLRARIHEVDRELVRLVGERRDLAIAIGRAKEALGLPVLDPPQEARVVRRAAELAREAGVDEEAVRDVLWRIIASARDAQEGRAGWGPPLASSKKPSDQTDPKEP